MLKVRVFPIVLVLCISTSFWYTASASGVVRKIVLAAVTGAVAGLTQGCTKHAVEKHYDKK
jgi:hypothetical protein